jgi:HEAT repeat protein
VLGEEMRNLLPTFLFASLLLGAVPSHAEDKAQERIATLAAEIIDTARPESGVGKEGQELAKMLAELDHAQVVEAVLPLLKHEKKGVPYLASYVILDCKDGLRPEHLEQLKKGFRNGGGWLPGAIESLGTDDAAEFLAKEFRANPQIHGQVDAALMGMGERAVPFLLKGFDDADPEREQRYFEGLRHIFKGSHVYDGMKDKAGIAIPHLIKVAESDDIPLRRRQEAIVMIGCVGKPAAPYFPRLRALAQRDPDNFADAVSQAIIESGTSSAAEVLADQVEAGADHYTVREIALLGAEAKEVGPRVLQWLDDADWEKRVMSAMTLGAIGYKDAREPLEELLSSQADWRLAYVSTKSLARLRAMESIPALEKASREHWFPIVRISAKEALGNLQNGEEPEGHGMTDAGDLVDYVFIDRNKLSIEDEDLKGLKPRKRSEGRRMSFAEFQQEKPALAEKFKDARDTNGEEMLEGFGSISEFPVDGGLLLGAAAGEWVGGLHYAPEKGDYRRLLHENITGIEKWKGRVFVVSGTYHMGMNEGMIHEFSIKDGKATLEPWFVLPGCPTRMWVTEDEKLIVASIGGTIAFADEGEFLYHRSEQVVREKKRR